jgi:hypothetical protein
MDVNKDIILQNRLASRFGGGQIAQEAAQRVRWGPRIGMDARNRQYFLGNIINVQTITFRRCITTERNGHRAGARRPLKTPPAARASCPRQQAQRSAAQHATRAPAARWRRFWGSWRLWDRRRSNRCPQTPAAQAAAALVRSRVPAVATARLSRAQARASPKNLRSRRAVPRRGGTWRWLRTVTAGPWQNGQQGTP